MAGILTGLPVSTPVSTVNRLCSSGLQAIADATAAINAGRYDVAIAGGVETMSTASMRNTEIRSNPKVRSNAMIPGCYLDMGKTSENVVDPVRHIIAGRQQSQIVLVHTRIKVFDKKAKKLTDDERSVVVAQNEGVRISSTADRLAALPAVCKKGGTTTPDNSSQLSDGATSVVLMKRKEATCRGIESFATLH